MEPPTTCGYEGIFGQGSNLDLAQTPPVLTNKASRARVLVLNGAEANTSPLVGNPHPGDAGIGQLQPDGSRLAQFPLMMMSTSDQKKKTKNIHCMGHQVV